jgi:hypothetical protein
MKNHRRRRKRNGSHGELNQGLRRIAEWVPDCVRRANPLDQKVGEEMGTPDMLREQLWQVREDALFDIALYGIEPTRLALAANASAALEALGEAPSWREPGSRSGRLVLDKTKAAAAPACRAVVSDDGIEIRLILHREDGKAASVGLSPAAAAFASRLIEPALPRLNGE